jgi:hypothetical protein
VFREALTQIVQRLEKAKAAGLLRGYGLIGGFAVAAWGAPRATDDIDFVLVTGSADTAKLAAVLGGQYRPGSDDDPLRGVFTTSVTVGANTVPIQLVLLPARWTDIISDRLQVLSVFGCSIPVVSWVVLLLLKLYAGGPQDLIDAREVWNVRQPDAESVREMRSLADSLGLSGEFKAFLQRVES